MLGPQNKCQLITFNLANLSFSMDFFPRCFCDYLFVEFSLVALPPPSRPAEPVRSGDGRGVRGAKERVQSARHASGSSPGPPPAPHAQHHRGERAKEGCEQWDGAIGALKKTLKI